MKNKKLYSIVSIVVLLVGAGIALRIVLKPHKKTLSSKPTPAPTSVKAEPPKPAEPDNSDHLVIKNIGVDSKIISVGLTKEGNMDTPNNIYDVGLYSKGAALGQKGTAVLAGHLDGRNGDKGVFYNLNQLKVGDIITINKKSGPAINYKVAKTQTYKSTDHPTEVFSSKTGSHLNLITCTGNWDKNKSQYDERLIVFTNLVN